MNEPGDARELRCEQTCTMQELRRLRRRKGRLKRAWAKRERRAKVTAALVGALGEANAAHVDLMFHDAGLYGIGALKAPPHGGPSQGRHLAYTDLFRLLDESPPFPLTARAVIEGLENKAEMLREAARLEMPL